MMYDGMGYDIRAWRRGKFLVLEHGAEERFRRYW